MDVDLSMPPSILTDKKRILARLAELGVTTVGGMRLLTPEVLLAGKDFGVSSYHELVVTMRRLGLSITGPLLDWREDGPRWRAIFLEKARSTPKGRRSSSRGSAGV